MSDYFETKKLIPKDNLIEVKFEEFEQNNLKQLKLIYDQFKLGTWVQAKPYLKTYIEAHKYYRKNKYKITKEELETIKTEWAFALEKWNYDIPDNLEIR